MYISNYLPQMGLLWWGYGDVVFHAVGVALLSIPIVLVAASLGLKCGSLLGDRWLRPITYACLVVLAARSLLDPWGRSILSS